MCEKDSFLLKLKFEYNDKSLYWKKINVIEIQSNNIVINYKLLQLKCLHNMCIEIYTERIVSKF